MLFRSDDCGGGSGDADDGRGHSGSLCATRGAPPWQQQTWRSEERRVGKECRSRRSPNHEKKKKKNKNNNNNK